MNRNKDYPARLYYEERKLIFYREYKGENKMHLKIDNYTDFELNINRTNKKETDPIDRWCEVSLKIENEYFKYKTINSEILMESDIEYLIKEFDKLLKGKIKEDEYIEFIEPDLEFILRPAKQIYEEETIDIRINLFQNGDYNSYKIISCVSDIHLDFKFEKSKSKYYVEVPIKETIKKF